MKKFSLGSGVSQIKGQRFVLFLSLVFCTLFSAPAIFAQDVEITLNPSQVKHAADSYIIGSNRNNVEEFVTVFDGAFGAGAYDNMINQYADIAPRFDKQRKLYRLGGSNVDGLASGQYGGGYHFQDWFGLPGPYANDDINYFIDEADQLDADMIIGVNVGSGTAVEAAALVQYFKDEGLLDEVAYFEMGNELMGNWQKGYADGVSCNATEYANYVVPFIDAMKAVEPSIKIAVCGSYVNSWEWPDCVNGSQENIPEIFDIFFDIIGDRFDYIAYHAYMPYEVIRSGSEQCKLVEGGPLQPVDDAHKARLVLGVSEWAVNNRIIQANNLIAQLKTQYNISREIKLVNTEFGTAISSEGLQHSMTEALYTADHMLAALNHDIQSVINFCLYHFQYPDGEGNVADLTDNIFFGGNGQGLKPTFYVHKLVAENMGSSVIETTIDQNTTQVNLLTCEPGLPLSYDKLGFASTKDADGTLRTMIINRSEQDLTLSVNVAGGANFDTHTLKSLAGTSFTDQPSSISSQTLADLNNITIPKLSVSVLISGGETDCGGGGGNSITACGVTLNLSDLNVSFASSTLTGQKIIKVRRPDWSWSETMCNDYTGGLECDGSSSVTVPGAGTFVVDVFNNGSSCTFEITLPAGGGGGSFSDVDNDGVCSDIDCDDNDPNIGAPVTPGTACDDMNDDTVSDVIQANGCDCVGEPEECEGGEGITIIECGVTFTLSGQTLTFVSSSLIGPSIIKVRTPTWSWSETMCNDYIVGAGCTASSSVTVPGNGSYVVDVANNGSSCVFDLNVTGTIGSGGGTDADNDGVCAEDDCDDNDPTVGYPQTPGTACDDDNAATDNDVILANGCDCAGETTGGCETSVTDCGVTLSLNGLTVNFVSTSLGGTLIIKVRTNNWSYAATLCNDYNNGTACSSSSTVTVPGPGSYFVDVQSNSGKCTFSIDLDNCNNGFTQLPDFESSRVSDGAGEGMKLYPIPANEEVHVQFDKGETGTVNLYGLSGELMKTLQVNEARLRTINTSELLPGVYFLEFANENYKYRQKLIIE